MAGGRRRGDETPELARLRRRIDALDRRIVALLNERLELARSVGREKAAMGRPAVRDVEREREVLLRVSMANDGPLPQVELLGLYRRLIAATRAIEARDRRRRETEAIGTDATGTGALGTETVEPDRNDLDDGG